MNRRDVVTLAAGALAWPITANAQQRSSPVVAFFIARPIDASTTDASMLFAAAFRNGLGEAGYIDGHNVTIEYSWLEGQRGAWPELVADVAHRRVAVIASVGVLPAMASKAATATIPIVFGVSEDPVKLGLVASLARPGGNATGVNFFNQEVIAKRLGLLHELVPRATRLAILNNPSIGPVAASTFVGVQQAAGTIGLQVQVLNVSSSRDIDLAFATLARERFDALFVAANGFFLNRGLQLATLAARERIPAAYGDRETVMAGGLMSYGTSIADAYHQVGAYTGRILKGEKPGDLPVVQPTKFEFVINLKTAKTLGLTIPPHLLAIADEVIE